MHVIECSNHWLVRLSVMGLVAQHCVSMTHKRASDAGTYVLLLMTALVYFLQGVSGVYIISVFTDSQSMTLHVKSHLPLVGPKIEFTKIPLELVHYPQFCIANNCQWRVGS